MSKDIGLRVKSVRGGMAQRDFAARLGISNGGISQIESGKAMPGGDFLLRIHQEFGVDVTWLLTGATGGVVPSSSTLTRAEAALLDNYRHSPADGQEAITRTAFALAKSRGMKKGAA